MIFSHHLLNYLEDYDRRIRPYDKVDRTNVSINIYVSSFDSLEETSMDYRITFFLVTIKLSIIEPNDILLLANEMERPATSIRRHG